MNASQVVAEDLSYITGKLENEFAHLAGKKLLITYAQDETVLTDSYYLADKDNNGIFDLYCEHLGRINPVASNLIQMECRKKPEGLWEINLVAGEGDITLCWEKVLRQKKEHDQTISLK